MAQKKAFVRYAQNKAVPGSLIVRTKAPKVGTWKEVSYDLCCGGGDCNFQPVVQQLSLGFENGNVKLNTPIIEIAVRVMCNSYPSNSYVDHAYGIVVPNIVFTNFYEIVDYVNTNFSSTLGYDIGTFTTDGLTITLATTTQFTICPSPFRIDFYVAD
jgi:hypothetical protein